MENNQDPRFERKYTLNHIHYQNLLCALKLHPAQFFEPYPPRAINNVYFDDISLNAYNDNVDGSFKREKNRIRWYGKFDSNIPISKLTMEVKKKSGFINYKDRYQLKSVFLHDIINGNVLKNNPDLPDVIKLKSKYLKPYVFNSYYQKYYLTRNKKIRLTIDTFIKYSSCFMQNQDLNNNSVKSNKIIIELKYELSNEEYASETIQYFPFSLDKNSKYINGIDKCVLSVWT